MTTQTLSSVAVHVVGRYNEAGKTLVGAYRVGGHRLLDAAARLPQAQKVTDFLGSRLDIDTQRVIDAMDRMAEASTNSIETVAGRFAQIDSPVATSFIDTMTKLNLPLANVSAQIADGVAAGAKQIDARVRGAEVAKAVRTVKAKAKTVRKTARRVARKAA